MLNFSAAMGHTFVGFLADRVGPVNALWSVIMLSGLTQLLVDIRHDLRRHSTWSCGIR